MERNNKANIGLGRPNMATQKAKNFKLAIKNLIVFCKKDMPLIVIAILLSAIASILAVVGPNELKELTNQITIGLKTNIDFSKIISITILLAIIYLLSAICMSLQGIFMVKVSQKVSQKMRTEIDNKFNRVPIKFVDATQHGDLLSRVTNDVDTISQGLNNSVSTLVHSGVLLLALIIMMFVTNWVLALTTIVCSIIGFLLIILVMSKSDRKSVV